jgi:hypothetical protein
MVPGSYLEPSVGTLALEHVGLARVCSLYAKLEANAGPGRHS